MGSRCFPIPPDVWFNGWFRADDINPELAEDRSGLKPEGTAERVFVADLVLGTDDRREDDNWPPPVVGDVEPAHFC